MMNRFIKLFGCCLTILLLVFAYPSLSWADTLDSSTNITASVLDDLLVVSEGKDGGTQSQLSGNDKKYFQSVETSQYKAQENRSPEPLEAPNNERFEAKGKCINTSTRAVGFYGPKVPDRPTYNNFLYKFEPGEQTKEDWDCDGVWIPSDARAVAFSPSCPGQSWSGPAAYKIDDLATLKIRSGPGQQIETDMCPKEVFTPSTVCQQGQPCWWIPDKPWSWIER